MQARRVIKPFAADICTTPGCDKPRKTFYYHCSDCQKMSYSLPRFKITHACYNPVCNMPVLKGYKFCSNCEEAVSGEFVGVPKRKRPLDYNFENYIPEPYLWMTGD